MCQLYLHERQKKKGVLSGDELLDHLHVDNLITRAYALEDLLVKYWLECSPSYPEEFKGKAIFLWNSIDMQRSGREVAYLIWDEQAQTVLKRWTPLRHSLGPTDPALLKCLH